MRQRNTTGGDLFVQAEPPFTLAPDEVVTHSAHIPGCEPVEDEAPTGPPADPPSGDAEAGGDGDEAESTEQAAAKPARARRTKIQEGM